MRVGHVYVCVCMWYKTTPLLEYHIQKGSGFIILRTCAFPPHSRFWVCLRGGIQIFLKSLAAEAITLNIEASDTIHNVQIKTAILPAKCSKDCWYIAWYFGCPWIQIKKRRKYPWFFSGLQGILTWTLSMVSKASTAREMVSLLET